MTTQYLPVKITDKVFWVGAIDWNIRDFHGYLTNRGTTYNAYLILGQKNVLIDVVKKGFERELLARISHLIDPQQIDLIISNHSELDHSGSLPEVLEAVKPEAVYASKMGVKALEEHFHRNMSITELKDGAAMDFAGNIFSFYETRMLHWPDSMFTFYHQDKILFSQDGFGMHLASEERFDDELELPLLEKEAAKYYANILLPYSPVAGKLLNKLQSLGLQFNYIAPDHGPVWRKNAGRILSLYSDWAAGKQSLKTVIIYDTMWGSTAKMAEAAAEGVKSAGVEAVLLSLKEHHRSDIATEILGAGAIIVGSPTLNTNLYPTIADALSYIEGLRPGNLLGAAFGSYGWNCRAVELIEDWLGRLKVEIVTPGVKVKYVPTEGDLVMCREMGAKVGEAVISRGGDRD